MGRGGLNQDAPCLEACHLPPDAPRSIRPQCKLVFWCLELLGEKKIGVVKKIFWKIRVSKFFFQKFSIEKNFFFPVFPKFFNKKNFFMSNLSSVLFELSFDVHIVCVWSKNKVFKNFHTKSGQIFTIEVHKFGMAVRKN